VVVPIVTPPVWPNPFALASIQKNPRRSSAYIYCYSISSRISVSTSNHSRKNGGASSLEEDREEEAEEVQEASK